MILVAGTDANITICLWGKLDGRFVRSGTVLLDQSNHRDKFERHKIDEFTLTLPDLGDIQRLQLTSDLSGFFGAEWFCDKVRHVHGHVCGHVC